MYFSKEKFNYNYTLSNEEKYKIKRAINDSHESSLEQYKMLFRTLFSYNDCNLSRKGISQGNNGIVYIAYLHESLVKKQM